MKKILSCLFILMAIFSTNIYGVTSNTNINTAKTNEQSVNSMISMGEELQEEVGELLSFDALKNIDYGQLFLNPFKIFIIFFEAILVVVLINFGAKILCKYMFNMSAIMKSRRQSRKLNKVLKDLYD